MDTGETAKRRAARARVALVARLRHIVEVIAARPLKQIAARGGLVSQLRAGPCQQRPAEDPVALPHALVRRQIAVPHHRADPQAPFRGILDLVQRETVDIDEMVRRLDLQLHQIEQIRSTRNEFGAGFGRGRRSLGQRIRALIGEGLHVSSPAACLIAAWMFG